LFFSKLDRNATRKYVPANWLGENSFARTE
jgi:hypothetical protein